MKKAIINTDQSISNDDTDSDNSDQEQDWLDYGSLKHIFHKGHSVGKTCALVALIIYIGMYVLYDDHIGLGLRALNDVFVDVIFVLTIGFSVILLAIWLTYLYSQTVGSTPAIRMSIALGTFMLVGNVAGFISITHHENNLTNTYLSRIVKSNYKTSGSSMNAHGYLKLNRIAFRHHHIYGYDVYNRRIFNYHYSDAYYDNGRYGVVFDGDYSNNVWPSVVNNYVNGKIKQTEDEETDVDSNDYTGYDSPDSIMAAPSGRHKALINFTGDAFDYDDGDNNDDDDNDHTEIVDDHALGFKVSKKYPKIHSINSEPNSLNQSNNSQNTQQGVYRQEAIEARRQQKYYQIAKQYHDKISNVGFKYGKRRCFILDTKNNKAYVSYVQNGQVSLNRAKYVMSLKSYDNLSQKLGNKMNKLPYYYDKTGINNLKARWHYYLMVNPYIVYNMNNIHHQKSIKFNSVGHGGTNESY